MTDLERPGIAAPTPREAVATLPAYVPGRRPAEQSGRPTYKLSSNENPNPPLPAVLAAATRAAAEMNRYPDMGCAALYNALGKRLGVPEERLAAATGSVAVLYHLLQAYCSPGDEVVHAWRSFEAYPIAIAVAGADAVPVPLAAEGRHDLPAMLAAITDRTRVVLVCTPNNPTGPAVSQAELAGFVAAVPAHVLVVVDEAYREFVRGDDPADALPLLDAHPNLVVMRTFAKAYAMAGLRVGYAVAAEPVAAAIRACSLPFGVSAIAQAAAVAALDHEPELMAQVDALVAERTRVVSALSEQGWQLPDTQGNFVWLALGDRTDEFARAADAAGVMVRPFSGDGVRVSIGEAAGNDVLLEVAARFR